MGFQTGSVYFEVSIYIWKLKNLENYLCSLDSSWHQQNIALNYHFPLRGIKSVWIWLLKHTKPAEDNPAPARLQRHSDPRTIFQDYSVKLRLLSFHMTTVQSVSTHWKKKQLFLQRAALQTPEPGKGGQLTGQPLLQSRKKPWSKPAPDHKYQSVLDTKHSCEQLLLS